MGRRLAFARNERGMTVRQVARRLGVSHVYVTQMENAYRPINAEYLLLFATIYGRSPAWLVWGDDPPPGFED